MQPTNSTKKLAPLPLAILLAATTGACGDSRVAEVPPAHSTAASTEGGPDASTSPTAEDSAQASNTTAPSNGPATPKAPEPSWRAAVRLERYGEAKKLLDALDDTEKSKPEMRYLRARVALEAEDYASVGPLLEGLDLPLFADDVKEMRARAAAQVGPYDVAVAFYEKSGRPRDWVRAARAAQKGGDTKRALALADKALTESQRLKRIGDERQAHAARVEILTAANRAAEALSDQKWLATQFPAPTEGRAARRALDNVKQGLTDKEKRAVVDALLDASAGKDAVDAVEKYSGAFSKAELAHRRAEALFKARNYQKAADAFIAASKLESGRTAEQLYYAGRALARSKKEDEGAKRYREVLKRFKKGLWAERASYQLAQLYLGQGRYDDAVKAFTEYLANFPDGSSRDDAEYALALALLSTKSPGEARKVLGKLASRAKKTEWGFLRELEGVAVLRSGDKDEAIRIFTQVATDQPLTWGAQMARARLTSIGAPLPPLVVAGAGGPSAPIDPALPAKAAELVALGLDADAEAHIADNEASISAPFTGRETEALCSMYAKLSRAKRRYKVGAAAVSFEALMRAPSPSERWAWECLYPRPYGERISELEKTDAVTPGLLHALMRQESGFDPEIRSPVGAEGLMQLMPNTAEQAAREARFSDYKAEDIRAPEVNLRLGSFYISKLLKGFQASLPLSVAAYNAGPGAVSRWVENAKELEADVFVARIPFEETRTYVARVLTNLARYEWLAGGDDAVQVIPLELPAKTDTSDDDY
ncbi:MAG: transglycosylase SLT domain-containing protein [Polyangiaceae bacterium]